MSWWTIAEITQFLPYIPTETSANSIVSSSTSDCSGICTLDSSRLLDSAMHCCRWRSMLPATPTKPFSCAFACQPIGSMSSSLHRRCPPLLRPIHRQASDSTPLAFSPHLGAPCVRPETLSSHSPASDIGRRLARPCYRTRLSSACSGFGPWKWVV